MSKEGSTISGLMDSFATAVSMALQYGVPLQALVDKFQHVRFEPSGWTGSQNIPSAKSLMDYIFRWLGQKFLTVEDQPQAEKAAPVTSMQMEDMEKQVFQTQADAPPCPECGSIMVRNGACYKCLNCGTTSGCS